MDEREAYLENVIVGWEQVARQKDEIIDMLMVRPSPEVAPTCPLCTLEGKPCPGGAHVYAQHEDGIHTADDYAKMRAAAPAVAPRETQGESVGAINGETFDAFVDRIFDMCARGKERWLKEDLIQFLANNSAGGRWVAEKMNGECPIPVEKYFAAAATTPVEQQLRPNDDQRTLGIDCSFCRRRGFDTCIYTQDGSTAHPYIAAPVESQGVERAQPVESKTCAYCNRPGKLTSLGWIHDDNGLYTCPAAQPVEGPREHDTNTQSLCPAAPVEGVERVRTCQSCNCAEVRHLNPPKGSMCECKCCTAWVPKTAQPVERVADDRPAETIPDSLAGTPFRKPGDKELAPQGLLSDGPPTSILSQEKLLPKDLKSYYHCKHFAIFTDVMEDWDFCNSLSLDSLIERIGRAETRIEVLEAALRALINASDPLKGLLEQRIAEWEWSGGNDSHDRHVRLMKRQRDEITMARVEASAALAAPSGEQTT